MKLLALIFDTFREIYAKKVIIGIIVIEVLTLAATAVILYNQDLPSKFPRGGGIVENEHGAPRQVPSEVLKRDSSLLDTLGSDSATSPLDTATLGPGRSSRTFDTANAISDLPPGEEESNRMLDQIVEAAMGAYATVIAGAVLFLGIFATAGIVPSMMEKGTIDLLLSKPLPRSALLFGRALGGFAAIAINVIFFTLALWAIYGTLTGVWRFAFVTSTIEVSLFGFLVFYSAVIFLNVLTESWVLPMSLAWIHMVVLSPFLTTRESTLYTFIDSPVIRSIIDGFYYALPQVQDLIQSLSDAIFARSSLPEGPLIQCTIFTIVMLALAAWRFEKKDF